MFPPRTVAVASLLFIVALVGCGGRHGETGIAVPAGPTVDIPSSGEIRLVFKIPPGQSASLRAGLEGVRVSCRLKLIDYVSGSVSLLSRTVPIDGQGQGRFVFSAIPAVPIIAEVDVVGGNVSGYSNFHGSIDALSGQQRDLVLVPIGSNLREGKVTLAAKEIIQSYPQSVRNLMISALDKFFAADELLNPLSAGETNVTTAVENYQKSLGYISSPTGGQSTFGDAIWRLEKERTAALITPEYATEIESILRLIRAGQAGSVNLLASNRAYCQKEMDFFLGLGKRIHDSIQVSLVYTEVELESIRVKWINKLQEIRGWIVTENWDGAISPNVTHGQTYKAYFLSEMRLYQLRPGDQTISGDDIWRREAPYPVAAMENEYSYEIAAVCSLVRAGRAGSSELLATNRVYLEKAMDSFIAMGKRIHATSKVSIGYTDVELEIIRVKWLNKLQDIRGMFGADNWDAVISPNVTHGQAYKTASLEKMQIFLLQNP